MSIYSYGVHCVSALPLHHVISVTRASELPRRLRRTAVSDMQARLSLQRVQRHMRDLRLSAAHRVKQVRAISAALSKLSHQSVKNSSIQ